MLSSIYCEIVYSHLISCRWFGRRGSRGPSLGASGLGVVSRLGGGCVVAVGLVSSWRFSARTCLGGFQRWFSFRVVIEDFGGDSGTVLIVIRYRCTGFELDRTAPRR